MKQLLYIIIITLMLFTVACETENFSEDLILETPLKENSLSGEWQIKAYVDNKELFGPFDIEVAYTSDLDSIIIKDNVFWGFKVKASTNKSANTFESNLSVNESSKVGAQIKILNGKVTESGSMNFEIQFEDDETPFGITYMIKGHKIK